MVHKLPVLDFQQQPPRLKPLVYTEIMSLDDNTHHKDLIQVNSHAALDAFLASQLRAMVDLTGD